jgi:prepilin-type N-terminal cleavage/methylation domain-containing protein
MKTTTNPKMRNAKRGMRNKKNAASAPNSLRTLHSAFRTSLAFTLIELLVVIAIIGVLAGFTLVVVKSVKASQYKSVARAELERLETALENYHAKYNAYPPSNQNPPSYYTAPLDRSQFNQLYYELSGVANNGGSFVTLDGSTSIAIADVTTAFGVGGFVNCTKGSGEDGVAAQNFISGLSAKQISGSVSNHSVPNNILITTSVGGPDDSYEPLGNYHMNPFRYLYPGVNNPGSYDLWVQLVISGQTNLICNWSRTVQINSPLP